MNFIQKLPSIYDVLLESMYDSNPKFSDVESDEFKDLQLRRREFDETRKQIMQLILKHKGSIKSIKDMNLKDVNNKDIKYIYTDDKTEEISFGFIMDKSDLQSFYDDINTLKSSLPDYIKLGLIQKSKTIGSYFPIIKMKLFL
jgi:hypothetical protein